MNELLLHRWWLDLQDDFSRPEIVWQLGVIALALAVGWWLSSALEQRVRNRAEVFKNKSQKDFQNAIHVGTGAFARVLFPLAVLFTLYFGKLVLAHFYSTHLLRLAITLALSFALVRVLVYLLRKAFRASAVLLLFERAIVVIIWLAVALHFTGLLDSVITSLDSLVLPLGKHQVSVYELLLGALSITVTLLVALWGGAALERWLMQSATLDSSLRAVFTRIGRALLIVLAILITLPLVGVDLTLLSVFGGALGVGLGLGLQRIASNYVSGFIILLEKSLRIGDMVTADKYYGTVTEIKNRYTVIRALDGTEAIIPNELFVAQPVLNHSYSDRKVRLSTRVGVAYHHDPEKVMPLLLQATAEQTRVLADPAPTVLLTEFAADGFMLELGFWIHDPEEGRGNVTSAINVAILRLFAANGIEIPYPRRDIHMKNS